MKIWLVFIVHSSYCKTFMKAFKTEELAKKQIEKWEMQYPELLEFAVIHTEVAE